MRKIFKRQLYWNIGRNSVIQKIDLIRQYTLCSKEQVTTMSVFFDDIRNDKKSAVNDFLTYIDYPYPHNLLRKDNPLWLLGIPPFSAETHFFVVDLFLRLVKASDWSEDDKELWIKRYVLNKPPKYVAKRIKRTPTWVNGRLYRCRGS